MKFDEKSTIFVFKVILGITLLSFIISLVSIAKYDPIFSSHQPPEIFPIIGHTLMGIVGLTIIIKPEIAIKAFNITHKENEFPVSMGYRILGFLWLVITLRFLF